MIRVLIVDERTEVRLGLHMRLQIEPDITIVGETGDAEVSLALAQDLEPDVIVVDTGMTGARGVDLVRRLRDLVPGTAVAVLTLCSDGDSRTRARQAGAQVFLDKYLGDAELLDQIRLLATPNRLASGPSIGPSTVQACNAVGAGTKTSAKRL